MANINYVELTKDVISGRTTELSIAIREVMNEAAGKDLPLNLTFDTSVNLAEALVNEINKFGNVAVSEVEAGLRSFLENFKESFKSSFDSASMSA